MEGQIPPQLPGAPGISPEDVKTCVKVLETILGNRMVLGDVAFDDRKALLMAAGKISRPDKLAMMKLAKAHRRNRRKKDRAHDRALKAQSEIRTARLASIFTAPSQAEAEQRKFRGRMKDPLACYVCKNDYHDIHFFYDSMCPRCGDFNYEKRFMTAPLHGRVALLTGARVKIGYHAALMLLRAGAKVIISTRFPHDSAQRFGKEDDFANWKDRLQIFGLDLRHSPSVELFCRYLLRTETRLDILINNAAQTVRRPPGFYSHLMELENATPSAEIAPLLSGYEQCKSELANQTTLPAKLGVEGAWVTSWQGAGVGIGIHSAAALSQIPYAYEPEEGTELFPTGALDADLQQVDLRSVNSWRLKLADVPAAEMLEVQLVNSIAPFILCSKLKPLMLKSPEKDKHVVNVSAMEGKFTRYTKTDKHPHTNMAKAALNMMTLTSAPDYAKDGIYMNAVDTGWVTDEDPKELSLRKQAEHDFQPPLDIVDGAARIVDPIFHCVITGEPIWGKFLKDYSHTDW